MKRKGYLLFIFGLFAMILIGLPKEVSASEVTDEFIKQFAPDGKNVVLKTAKPKDDLEAYFFMYGILGKYDNPEGYRLEDAHCEGEGYTICTVELYSDDYREVWDDALNQSVVVQGEKVTYTLNATYEEPSSADTQVVNTYLSKLKDMSGQDSSNWYEIEDLSLINYYLTSVKSELWHRASPGRALKFVKEFNEITDGTNITFNLVAGLGNQDESLMYESAFGPLTAFYNGYAYYAKEQGLYLKRVIYISENTADTKEAYIEAAQKRIDNYLGKSSNVVVSYGGLLSSLEPHSEDSTKTISSDGNYYNVKVLDRTYKFYIVKTSEENIVDPVYSSKNNSTNISITSDSGLVPLDTKIDAVELTSGAEYERIINILDLDANVTYDIKLYSDANQKYITKLDDGTFNVTIPVPAELEGKNLVVYYVNENGEVEEYSVTPTDGFVSFNTNHFSIYTLGYKSGSSSTEELPNTFDSVGNSLIISILSVIGLIGSVIYLNRKNRRV